MLSQMYGVIQGDVALHFSGAFEYKILTVIFQCRILRKLDVPKYTRLMCCFVTKREPWPIYLINDIIMEIDTTKSLYSVIADVQELANELLLMYLNPSRNYISLQLC